MDPHAQWLRRYVAAKVAARLGAESLVVAVAAGTAAVALGLPVAASPLAGLVAGQSFAVVRVGVAWLANPITLRYLLNWEADTDRLEPLQLPVGAVTDPGGRFSQLGFSHAARLGAREPDHAGPSAARDVFRSGSNLVLVAIDSPSNTESLSGTDGPSEVGGGGHESGLTVVSRLADGRLVVTSRSVVPPHRAIIVNRGPDATPTELMVRHVELLEQLRVRGLRAVPVGVDAAIEQLGCEWEAWNRLGPFLGPFLAVDGRRQPHLLLAHLPDRLPARLLGRAGDRRSWLVSRRWKSSRPIGKSPASSASSAARWWPATSGPTGPRSAKLP